MELSKPRICARCGQEVNPIKDSWTTEAGRMQHVTCPTSAALADLAVIQTTPADQSRQSTEAGQAGPLDRHEFYTVAEAAEILRTHPQTIRRYIRAGHLPAKRLPGGPKATVLISRSALLGLLEDAREAA